jgi:hypothetical protein
MKKHSSKARRRSSASDGTEGVRAAPIPEAMVVKAIAAESTGKVARVFISYRSQESDLSFAQEFHEALKAAGHHAFMAGECIRLGESWPQRIDAELEQCDYFLLLLSPQSAVSEMVTEEVRRAKQLRDTRPDRRPQILPVRVNFPMRSPLNYDLRSYLQQIQQREWKSSADTPMILQEILSLIAKRKQWGEHGEKAVDSLLSNPPVDTPETPPLPVAEPELYREPGGSVPLDSGLYLKAEVEAQEKCLLRLFHLTG